MFYDVLGFINGFISAICHFQARAQGSCFISAISGALLGSTGLPLGRILGVRFRFVPGVENPSDWGSELVFLRAKRAKRPQFPNCPTTPTYKKGGLSSWFHSICWWQNNRTDHEFMTRVRCLGLFVWMRYVAYIYLNIAWVPGSSFESWPFFFQDVFLFFGLQFSTDGRRSNKRTMASFVSNMENPSVAINGGS